MLPVDVNFKRKQDLGVIKISKLIASCDAQWQVFVVLFDRTKNFLSEKAHLMCYRICVRALTAIITYHDR